MDFCIQMHSNWLLFFFKVQSWYLSDEGERLILLLKSVQEFYLKMRKSKGTWNLYYDFISKTICSFFDKDGENFRQTLIFDLPNIVILWMEGMKNHQLGEYTMNFSWLLIVSVPNNLIWFQQTSWVHMPAHYRNTTRKFMGRNKPIQLYIEVMKK